MAVPDQQGTLHVRVENVGGIAETEVTLPPGVTVLSGRNATNRTSFLRAIMGVMGSDDVSLKGDARTGRIELSVGDETRVRELPERAAGTAPTGEAYLDPDDVELGELFAFLLRENEARRAIVRGGDLREVIMRPVDTGAIEAEIERLESEKRRLDRELDRLDGLEADLTDLVDRRARLRSEVEKYEARLDAKRAKLDGADERVADSNEREDELESVLEELREAQSDLKEVTFRLETERESLAALGDERADIAAELEELPDVDTTELSEIDAEIDRLREHEQSLESTMNQLQRIVGFNEDVLSGGQEEVREALETDAGDAPVTDELVADRTVCWTCGSEVDTGTIRETVDRLRDLRAEKASERRSLESDLEELTERKERHERRTRERERLRERRETVAAEIADREEATERLEERRETLSERVEELETRADDLEQRDRSETLAVHKEVNRLEIERDRTQENLEEITGKIEEIEAELDRREDLRADLDACTDQLTELRTRIERLESEAIEAFNEHVATVLDVLGYENLERIWIERTRDTAGRGATSQSSFDLHVVRSTAEGTTYEDHLDHLSESEREVTGLVFALAGYLVHDVHERVPIMLLDSLEAIDSERIADLVAYFESFPEYLVVALLPEDARALGEEYTRVSDI